MFSGGPRTVGRPGAEGVEDGGEVEGKQDELDEFVIYTGEL